MIPPNIDSRILERLETLSADEKRGLLAFALEILGCVTNGCEKLAGFEIEEEAETAGL